MQYICKRCGIDLGEANSDGEYICPGCGLRVKEDYKDMKATIEQSLDDAKQQSIANARRNMWAAICEDYLSDDIVKWSDKILEFLPDDFYANFYKKIYTADKNSLNDYIKNIDVKANYASIESMVDFILKAIDDVNLLPLNNLVERAYKGIDNAMFERVSTKVSDKAEKINNGVYNLTISRDVFIMYSSKDMDKVEQVVEAFESNGISCFVAMRNLRHGRGARDSYAEALKEAMNNCKTVVFVSTPNSRDMYCDTLRVELPYLKAYDIAGFPQYRNNYESMPNDLKKFRVQLVFGEEPKKTKIADKQANSYFTGYEYCYAIDEAITRVYTSITEIHLLKNNVENKAPEENLQVISDANADVSALIEKARVQIEDEDYADAEATCDKISDLDIKNADLWICKLLIEAKVADLKTLATVAINLEESNNYKRAIRFGNEQQQVECKNAVEKAKFLVTQEQMRKEAERKELERKELERKEAEKYCTENFDIEQNIIKKYKGKLTKVVIPSSITAIGKSAFENCRGLTSITIPSSVTTIGESAFVKCCELTSITIPSSVTAIGYGAFNLCIGLISITISSSVTAIGDSTFYGCVGLTSITIPSSVTAIGESAFFGCRGLTSITIPSSVTAIGKSAFYGCNALSITIAHGVTSIVDRAFFGCDGLTSITIPSSVTAIGDYAFSGCSGLTSITIPSSVTAIGDSAFWGCNALTSITIPSSVTAIDDCAFKDCSGLTSITIPSSVTVIGDFVFSGCSGLTSITIPSSVTAIGTYAFYGCNALTSITIPSSVTAIGGCAFSWCSGLTSITIPSSVTVIGDFVFSGCSGLTSIIVESKKNSKSWDKKWKKGCKAKVIFKS